MTTNDDHDFMIKISYASHTKIVTELAYWQQRAETVETAAREGAGEWRTKMQTAEERHQDMRDALHTALGITVPLSDQQLIDQITIAVRAGRAVDQPALATVDQADYWPDAEQLAAAVVIGPPVHDAGERTETMPPIQVTELSVPSNVAGVTGRRWQRGEPYPETEIILAVANKNGDVWRFVEFTRFADDSNRRVDRQSAEYCCSELGDVRFTFVELLDKYDVLYEVVPADQAVTEQQGANA